MENFITDDYLLDAVKAVLGLQSSDTLSDEWTPIVVGANRQATLDIYERLCAQGFTTAQVAAWDLAADYAKQQGVFWALTWGAGLGNYSGPKEQMDRRDDLVKKSVLIIDGTPTAVTTGESQVGGVTHGNSNVSRELNRFGWNRQGL